MSIATMSQLTVIGRKKIAQELLSSLQSLGVVQIDPLEPSTEQLKKFVLNPSDKAQKEGWDAAVAKSAGLIDALGVQGVGSSSRADVANNAADVNAQLATIASQVDKLVAERADYRDELEVIRTYLPTFRDLTPSSGQLDTSRYLQTLSFIAPAESLPAIEKNFRELLQDRVDIAARPRGKDMMITAVVLKKDRELLRTAVSRSGFSELALPDRYKDLGVAKAVHTMEERSQSLPKRLSSIDEELSKLATQHGGKLQAIHQVSLNYQSRFDKMTDMAESRYGFALQGWVPSVDNSRVVDSLKKQFGDEVVVESREADEHHDEAIPVKLENAGWIKPFEGLLSLFAPPKYGNFDPAWVLAVFFPFFFGLVVGDIGFGLMFAAIGWWMRRRGEQGKALDLGILGITIQPGALRPISTVIFWCSAWAILFGFLFGEFFGNLLEHWHVFYVPGEMHEGEASHGLIPILLPRVIRFTPLLVASLGFGILQVLGGWLIRVIYGFKHHDMKHVWEGAGMLGGLIGLIVFAWGYLTGNLNGGVTAVLWIGLAVFVLGLIMSRVFLMIIELASNAGAILSYLRLFAVGLSSALVANLATDLGFAIGGTLPVIGPILGILIGLAVHLIAIALTIIGHTLQPLRLNYVEFFTKFGFYDESGRPYRPFRLLGGK
jgi:V/A-type H+/Na+-transporting ATPase subunit I